MCLHLYESDLIMAFEACKNTTPDDGLHPLLRRQIREATQHTEDGGIDYDLLFQMVSESYADMDSPLTVGLTGVTHVKEEKAKQVERRFLSIIENVPGVVYQWYERKNGERGFYYISPRVKEFYGVEPEAMIQDPQTLPIHPDDTERWENSVRELVLHPRDWSFEGRFLLPDGRVTWWRGLSKPTIISADEVVFDGILMNIDAEKNPDKKPA